ncbi:MAG: hypothetical protein J6X78_03050, partial [Treponema sp.]|nr:hypothetical protein [Treponema sp.]
ARCGTTSCYADTRTGVLLEKNMKKYFLVLLIFSNFYFSFADDFHHKYVFYKFENETRLQTIVTNIFNESNKKIKTIETRIPYNMPIYSSEEIEYEYTDNQLSELNNGNKIHSYKFNDENKIIEENFYDDNKLDIFNTVKYEYENGKIIKKKSFASEYKYTYSKDGDLIEITDNHNNKEIFKYKKKNNQIIQEQLFTFEDGKEIIQYTKKIFYNKKGQVVREEIYRTKDPVTLAEFFDNQDYIEIIIYDYL